MHNAFFYAENNSNNNKKKNPNQTSPSSLENPLYTLLFTTTSYVPLVFSPLVFSSCDPTLSPDTNKK